MSYSFINMFKPYLDDINLIIETEQLNYFKNIEKYNIYTMKRDEKKTKRARILLQETERKIREKEIEKLQETERKIREKEIEKLQEKNVIKQTRILREKREHEIILQEMLEEQERMFEEIKKKTKQATGKDQLSTNENEECKICYTNKKCIILIPCSHSSCCIECSKNLNKCPICREKITNKIFYISS